MHQLPIAYELLLNLLEISQLLWGLLGFLQESFYKPYRDSELLGNLSLTQMINTIAFYDLLNVRGSKLRTMPLAIP